MKRDDSKATTSKQGFATRVIHAGQAPDPSTLKGKRDRALLGILLGCGLRRKEAAELDVAHLQRREDHWAIVDLVGKARQSGQFLFRIGLRPRLIRGLRPLA